MVTKNNPCPRSEMRSGPAFVCRPFAVFQGIEQGLLLIVEEVCFLRMICSQACHSLYNLKLEKQEEGGIFFKQAILSELD